MTKKKTFLIISIQLTLNWWPKTLLEMTFIRPYHNRINPKPRFYNNCLVTENCQTIKQVRLNENRQKSTLENVKLLKKLARWMVEMSFHPFRGGNSIRRTEKSIKCLEKLFLDGALEMVCVHIWENSMVEYLYIVETRERM